MKQYNVMYCGDGSKLRFSMVGIHILCTCSNTTWTYIPESHTHRTCEAPSTTLFDYIYSNATAKKKFQSQFDFILFFCFLFIHFVKVKKLNKMNSIKMLPDYMMKEIILQPLQSFVWMNSVCWASHTASFLYRLQKQFHISRRSYLIIFTYLNASIFTAICNKCKMN